MARWLQRHRELQRHMDSIREDSGMELGKAVGTVGTVRLFVRAAVSAAAVVGVWVCGCGSVYGCMGAWVCGCVCVCGGGRQKSVGCCART